MKLSPAIRQGARDLLVALSIAFALLFYIENSNSRAVGAIRGDLNELGRNLCDEGARVDAVGQYNSALDALIEDLTKREEENILRGDNDKARINAETRTKLRLAKIKAAPANCDKPLLPEGG